YGSGMTVSNVSVHDNVSGGIVASGTAVQVTNTLVAGNDPSGQNGGIWVGAGSVLRNITVQARRNAIVGGMACEECPSNGRGGGGPPPPAGPAPPPPPPAAPGPTQSAGRRPALGGPHPPCRPPHPPLPGPGLLLRPPG